MKKTILLLCMMIPIAGLALDPATITMTNLRDEAVSTAATNEIFYRGDVIRFTNCIAYAGATTSSAVQDLTGLTIILSVGDTATTSTSATGTVVTATSGVWGVTVTLPTDAGTKTYIQLQLTNSDARFTYPFKFIEVKPKL